MRRSWFLSLLPVVPMLASLSAAGEQIPNWHVPPTWTPPQPAGALSTMTDISSAIPFVAVTPCRIADTRGNGFTGQAGPPFLTANTARVFQVGGTVAGLPAQCGIPSNANAVSFQFTIIQPSGAGNLIAWPGGTPPNVSVLNWDAGITALGNGTIVPLSTNSVSVQVNAATGVTAQLVIDVNGFFSVDQNSGTQFRVVTTANSLPAVEGVNNSASANSYGVKGQVGISAGAGSAGVFGLASGTTGTTFGVLGKTSSTSTNSAGVKGVDSGGEISTTVAAAFTGVRGDSASGVGVSGFSRTTGVAGSLLDGANPANVLAAGYLGYSVGTYGVYASGDIGATGMKFFVEPHPTDASKVIRFVALEGPEAGTYFRGSSRTVAGSAIVEVPESFRIVTDEEGLTVQLTAVGALVPLAVITKDLNRITVRSSRDVAFDYEVKGVRRGFTRFDSIAEGREFMPESADARLPAHLSNEARQRLITNGTFNQDGSVNLTTAERLGWTRVWVERDRPPASARSTQE